MDCVCTGCAWTDGICTYKHMYSLIAILYSIHHGKGTKLFVYRWSMDIDGLWIQCVVYALLLVHSDPIHTLPAVNCPLARGEVAANANDPWYSGF